MAGVLRNSVGIAPLVGLNKASYMPTKRCGSGAGTARCVVGHFFEPVTIVIVEFRLLSVRHDVNGTKGKLAVDSYFRVSGAVNKPCAPSRTALKRSGFSGK